MADALSGRVLVTGATGLIGSWVTRQWPDSGPALLPLGSRDVDLLAPGAPTRLLHDLRPTDVVHLAWSASADPAYRHSEVNGAWLNSTLELLSAARSAGVRCWLTGSVVDDGPVDPGPDTDSYSVSKARLRRACADDIGGGAIGWLRPTYVVDEARGRPALVAESLDAVREGRAVPLRSPLARHDFVHAADVGSAIVLAVVQQLAGVLPIGSGAAHSVAELVTCLGAAWTQQPWTSPAEPRQSALVADVGWLTSRGWAPRRTDVLFGREDGKTRPTPLPERDDVTVRPHREERRDA